MAGCAAVSIFLLVGRWSPSRLIGTEAAIGRDIVMEPRFWIALFILLLGSTLKVFGKGTCPRNHTLRRVSDWSIIFLAYMSLSTIWAPSWGLATEKAIELIVLIMAIAGTFMIFSSFQSEWIKDGIFFFVFCVGILLALLAGKSAVMPGRTAALGGGPNVFARIMALLMASCFYFGVERQKRMYSSLMFVVGIFAFALLLMSGSRGGLLAATGAAVLCVFQSGARFSRKIGFIVFLGIAAFVSFEYSAIGQKAKGVFEERVIKLTVEKLYDFFSIEVLGLIFIGEVCGSCDNLHLPSSLSKVIRDPPVP